MNACKKRNTMSPTLNHHKTMLHQFLKVPYFTRLHGYLRKLKSLLVTVI